MSAALAHRVEGSGPPVLLLNGGMMSISSWDTIASQLTRRFMVIRCDFRGQLLSPGEAPKDLDGHAADVARLLDHLELPAVNVVGTSFGAEVGVVLAAGFPRRVTSLIAATAVDFAPPEMQRLGETLIAAGRAAVSEGRRLEYFAELSRIIYSPHYLAAHLSEFAEREAELTSLPETWFAGVERLLVATSTADLRPLLGDIRCPTLVVLASEDRLMPAERSRALAGGIAGAELVEVAGSGHALVVERPDLFVDLVAAFLERHTGGKSAEFC